MTPVPLAELNAMDKARFVAALGGIYENSPWVAESVFTLRPIASLAALQDAMSLAVKKTSDANKRALLDAHPDLAGKAARAGTVTADSKQEQNSVGLDRLNQAEFDTLHRLNDAYRSKFGFPFIICVRRHTKDSIFRQIELRLRKDAMHERETALGEVDRIAALRLDQYVSAADRLKVHGRLSTHVLDTYNGRPAMSVGIELHELSSTGEARLVANGSTNVEGRTDAPLIGGRPIPIGHYELRFAIGAYFGGTGAALAEPPFLDVVPLRFGVAEPEGHYHVPLVASPWSYSTYRGS
jgi:2-oxo-4-hydroxy-4-carboxy-5-ureidoimidazoline decarboxylase